MKTIYIPKGETITYDSLQTERLIVKGSLHVRDTVHAKTIDGTGVINAETVHADVVRIGDLACASVVCKQLLAKRVETEEFIASDSAAVSCFLSAKYVETGRLTCTCTDIASMKVEQVINLPSKQTGLMKTLLLSALRAFWLSLTTRAVKTPAEKKEPVQTVEEAPAESEQTQDNSTQELVASVVREVLAEQQKSSSDDASDFELKRFTEMFKLLRDEGYTLRVIPGTPEENAPVFDPETEAFLRDAA